MFSTNAFLILRLFVLKGPKSAKKEFHLVSHVQRRAQVRSHRKIACHGGLLKGLLAPLLLICGIPMNGENFAHALSGSPLHGMLGRINYLKARLRLCNRPRWSELPTA
ncbi:hypothetical protein AVEN_110728-1 [Araneus ventricosus]|uniref:Uncharacterized protein n=1 Tax=Araneus ventricosus TaxID=182803 RepID=A0A4Y2CR51_ARAVE|nr:hypothetical protein AVEN_192225-1 [Araneus ventricosus]GBM05785.1 hypothetical protein AVEN_110728-1 [Araneus ventricosus]